MKFSSVVSALIGATSAYDFRMNVHTNDLDTQLIGTLQVGSAK